MGWSFGSLCKRLAKKCDTFYFLKVQSNNKYFSIKVNYGEKQISTNFIYINFNDYSCL